MMPEVLTAIAGGVGGLVKATIGYFKVKHEEDFNVKFFITTLVEGALAGLVIGYAIPVVPAAFFAGLGVAKLADFNDLWADYRK